MNSFTIVTSVTHDDVYERQLNNEAVAIVWAVNEEGFNRMIAEHRGQGDHANGQLTPHGNWAAVNNN